MIEIAIINGPNLNLLGSRETHHYGVKTLEDITTELTNIFEHRALLHFFQSNHEGALIDHIQAQHSKVGIIINPGAFTHTSIGIRDALLAVSRPTIEVHVSNIFAREQFRKHSFISDVCLGVISGLGAYGYRAAVEALLNQRA